MRRVGTLMARIWLLLLCSYSGVPPSSHKLTFFFTVSLYRVCNTDPYVWRYHLSKEWRYHLSDQIGTWEWMLAGYFVGYLFNETIEFVLDIHTKSYICGFERPDPDHAGQLSNESCWCPCRKRSRSTRRPTAPGTHRFGR